MADFTKSASIVKTIGAQSVKAAIEIEETNLNELITHINQGIINDETPQLGGDLDLNGHVITAAPWLEDLSDDTSPTLGGNLDCNDLEVSKPLFKDSAETTYNWGSRSTTTSIDCSVANVQSLTIGADLTILLTNPPATGRTGIILLEVTNGGAHTVTWDTDIIWDSGSAPGLQTSGVDILAFITRDAGATWRGVRCWKEA